MLEYAQKFEKAVPRRRGTDGDVVLLATVEWARSSSGLTPPASARDRGTPRHLRLFCCADRR